MCKDKEKSNVLKLSNEELLNIIKQDVINSLSNFYQNVESNGDSSAFTKKLEFICDINNIIAEINSLEKYDTEHELKKLTEIKSYFIAAKERYKKNLNEIIDSMDKDFALTTLKKMKNLYASSNNLLWPSKEKVEVKLGINYTDFMKNEVDNFLYELDNEGKLDDFIRLLCACIFQEESEAVRYVNLFIVPATNFLNLIKEINNNLQSTSFDSQWPSKSDVENTLDMTYEEYRPAVEKILKDGNKIQKGSFIRYLIACVFHDEKQAEDSFLIVSLSGLELMKELNKKLVEKQK